MSNLLGEFKPVFPTFADIYRDGASYGLGFKSCDGEKYELHLKVVADSPPDCKRYYEPLIFRGRCRSQDVLAHPSWQETSEFLKDINFENERFVELKWIVENKGWSIPK